MPLTISTTDRSAIGNAKRPRDSKAKREGRPLTAQQEAWCRCFVVHGMTKSDAYRAAYQCQNMADTSINAEASKLSALPHVASRVKELRAEMARVDLLDHGSAQRFVLDGLSRIALNGDSSASQLRAYELIGKLRWMALFSAQTGEQQADTRDAQTLRDSLARRLQALLPAPEDSTSDK